MSTARRAPHAQARLRGADTCGVGCRRRRCLHSAFAVGARAASISAIDTAERMQKRGITCRQPGLRAREAMIRGKHVPTPGAGASGFRHTSPIGVATRYG